ncbi:hypothetical protein [Marilutibacter alkalisoli]|uniref:Uncharacterized protein n=1 Tax=Marilutibacter alkalisoli TaxID=2591633 RepID=A0A514BRY8_9GAMM|nr:hypothetical protein [Lysobacter alkalisoli]QDH70168.1 hypothetical protein FKV23_08705 [Lysobacter alkalisoli]
MKFEMKILNVFRLSNGRTVLGGLVANHPQLIKACDCELISEEGVRQRISLEGEQIVKKISTNDLRALATVENVMLTEEEAQSGNWRLICTDNG